MNKFIRNIFLFFSPFFIIILIYIELDPFKVVKNYDTFYDNMNEGRVSLNRDYVSTKTFDVNYINKNYNSFIFGNSCSNFYQVDDWKKYLKEDANCYHFEAAGETLYGLNKKVKYIDNKKIKIKNALIILDYSVLTQIESKNGHLVDIPPQLENNKNFISFHYDNFKAFLYPSFICAYVEFKLSGKIRPYMKQFIENFSREYDVSTNEFKLTEFEQRISKGEYYNEQKIQSTLQRDTIESSYPCIIAENQRILLQEIFDIFNRHKTNYKIIISPLYEQIKINNKDFNYLVRLFGKKNVFDFSGKNKFTNDYHNYYEPVHYRPHVAREIMELIYRNEQIPSSNNG